MGWAFEINISLSVFESGCATGKLYLQVLFLVTWYTCSFNIH